MPSLQLRMYYFFISSDHDIRRQGLLKAYTTSLSLISKVAEANEKFDFIKYAPNGYSQFLVIASILVMKIIHSSYSKYIDIDEGKRVFDTIIFMFRRASVEDNDIRGRVGKILTNLWSFHQSFSAKQVQEEPKLNIKTRLGASLLHDSLWTWRKELVGREMLFELLFRPPPPKSIRMCLKLQQPVPQMREIRSVRIYTCKTSTPKIWIGFGMWDFHRFCQWSLDLTSNLFQGGDAVAMYTQHSLLKSNSPACFGTTPTNFKIGYRSGIRNLPCCPMRVCSFFTNLTRRGCLDPWQPIVHCRAVIGALTGLRIPRVQYYRVTTSLES